VAGGRSRFREGRPFCYGRLEFVQPFAGSSIVELGNGLNSQSPTISRADGLLIVNDTGRTAISVRASSADMGAFSTGSGSGSLANSHGYNVDGLVAVQIRPKPESGLAKLKLHVTNICKLINASHQQSAPSSLNPSLPTLRTIRIRINPISRTNDQLREVHSYTLPDIKSSSLIIVVLTVIIDIAKRSFRTFRPMMLKKLRLHREAIRKLSAINTVTDIAEHKIVGCRHFVHAEFVEQTTSSGLGNSVRERAGIHSRTGDDSSVGGVLLDQLAAAVLHVQVLRLGDCAVVGEDDSAEGGVDVASLWEAAAAVAQPEEVPARNVTVGRVHGLGRGVSVDLEVCITLVCVWLRVCWVQVLVGCICLRLNE
jgi:hypothetical protein